MNRSIDMWSICSPAAPDKAAIKKAIAAGEEVPGAKLTQGTRLKIA